MFKYVIKRLIYAIPVFLGITFAIYLLINLAPGGPLAILASSGEMSQADLEAMRIELGLDKPIIIRYFLWLADLFHGDLGTSYRTSQDVAMMISQRIQPSLTLTGVGIVGAILIGIPLGIISAYKPNSIWDHISTFISFIGASVPSFFLSLLMIYVLACIPPVPARISGIWYTIWHCRDLPAAFRLSETILSRPSPVSLRY